MKSLINDYINFDAVELIKQMENKNISSSEVMSCASTLIETLNPQLNFMTRIYKEPVCAQNTKNKIPFLLKDCGLNLAGTETTYATKSLVGQLAKKNSELTQSYLNMGLSILGKTTTPEFCTTGVTESELYGKTKNPWNPLHTPGGSSGGSATAVAARVVPIASGDDGGGSIRIPAALCGLIGLKPTIGVTTDFSRGADSWHGLTTKHVLTRTTRDSLWALIHSCNNNYLTEKLKTNRNKYDLNTLLDLKKKFKIGYSTESFYGSKTDSTCSKAVQDLISLLKKNGHTVEEQPIASNEANIKKAYLILVAHSIYKHIESIKIKKLNYKSVELGNWLLYTIGKKTNKTLLNWAIDQCDIVKNDIDFYLNKFDFFINPSTATPSHKLGLMDLSLIESTGIKFSHLVPNVETLYKSLDHASKKGLAKTPNTQFTNLSGHPSISIPVSLSPNGTPLGVQITGKYFSELDLLKLSAEVEKDILFYKKSPKKVPD